MAPVAPWLSLLLAAGFVADNVSAKPLFPGRHAPPAVANLLSSHTKKDVHAALAKKLAKQERSLTKPPAMSEHAKRAALIPAGWSYTGCVDESWDQRLLQGMGFSSGSMTPTLCLQTCQASGFIYGGTEFADECFCGNSFMGSGGTVGSDASCQSPCGGDSSIDCGGSWMLSLYQFNGNLSSTCPTTSAGTPTATGPTATVTAAPPTYTDADASEWYSLGCAQDSTTNRLLDGSKMQYVSNMTIDYCLTTCEDQHFSFAGLEWGQECWCGNSVPSTITYTDSKCTYTCTGDSSETCGGYGWMDLYEIISGSSTCPTTSTTTSSIGQGDLATPPVTVTGSSATAAPTNVPSSPQTHNVYAHFMVGNTYPYTQSNWAADIAAAQAAGIDGFALNMGSDPWQPGQIQSAYAAAAAASNSFTMFLSLDMTALSCASQNDAQSLVSLVQQFAGNSNQAKHNGQVLVSTFAGSDCTFGTGSSDAWQDLFVNALSNVGVNIFFVPSIFSDPSTFASTSWMDGELNWNSGWPMGDYDLTTASDVQYMAALGSKEYMPAISPFFYTHFGVNSWNKNWLYRGDDWLYCTRWEQVIAMRDQVVMTELLTWNDWGESSYIGPQQDNSALPAGSSVWVDGFDHTGLNALTNYYATAFKTGSYPAITTDTLIMWSRPHPYAATASNDPVGRPTGWNWTTDNVWAVVMATAPASVTLTSGSYSQTFQVVAGLNKLQIPSNVGGLSGQIVRNGQTVASYQSNGFSYTDSPVTYNYNYFVGSSS